MYLGEDIVIADGHAKRIGNHVQLASNVVIAKEVTMADGCKLSACSFLNKNVMRPQIRCMGEKTGKRVERMRAIDSKKSLTAQNGCVVKSCGKNIE